MKSFKYYLFLICITISIKFLYVTTIANNLTIYGEYTVGNLTFTSYSKSWDTENLKELYLELLNNFHSDEFNYLKNIYIFPNSPYGVNGYYKEDCYIENGEYVLGDNASIEIFNGDTLNTIDKIAPILSHEYGHHYTIYNIFRYEGIYVNNYENSEYYKIRNLSEYPISLNYTGDTEYVYHWDILELLAYDYVQLLGSSRAKQSTDFKDLEEMAKEKISSPDFYINAFNSKPQINPYLPLASEVEGLYNYFLKIAGYTSSSPELYTYPKITGVVASKTITGETMFKVNWSEAVGLGTLEYTVVMYPLGNPFSVIPIKTVYGTEDLSAIFGSYSLKNEDGSIYTVNHPYIEEVVLKIYVKDTKGYIYSSEPATYNLTELSNNLTTQTIQNQTSTKNNYTYKNNSSSNNNSNQSTDFNVSNKINSEDKFILQSSLLALLNNSKK